MTPAQQNNQSNQNNQKVPFWQPWGALGCLGRALLFLLGLFLLSLLFGYLLNKTVDTKWRNFGDDNYGVAPVDTIDRGGKLPIPDSIISDTTIPDDRYRQPSVPDWGEPIPGVPELPDSAFNYIPPFDPDEDLIENPEDPFTRIVADQLSVFFSSQDVKADIASFARQFKSLYPSDNYKIVYYNTDAGSMILSVPSAEIEKIASELPSRIQGIDFYVATNDVFSEQKDPQDPMFKAQYAQKYFNLIQAFDAWDKAQGSKNVKVGIVDSYFDLSNPEIGSTYENPIYIPTKSRNVLPPSRMPVDDDDYGLLSHGSHVAGIAVGLQDNGMGVSGIAPGCTWIPVALGDQMTEFNIIEGILYAIYQGADVVNVSLGRNFPDNLADQITLDEQVEYSKTRAKRNEALWKYVGKVAQDHNALIVIASGNESLLMGMDPMNRPDNLIKVEAVDADGIKAKFSNYGDVPEDSIHYSTVSAPGVELWSVLPRNGAQYLINYDAVADPNGFGPMSGTSMAAPVVTGAIALLKSKNPNATAEEIKQVLISTARQTDTNNRIGPTIQLADALDAIGGEKMNFDEVINDHNKLIGVWRSTNTLMISDENDEKVDDIWTYFIFTSPTEGKVEHRCTNLNRVYTAPIKVTWGKQSIQLTQLSQAVDQTGNTLSIDHYSSRPNINRHLETDCLRNGKVRFSFELEKVN